MDELMFIRKPSAIQCLESMLEYLINRHPEDHSEAILIIHNKINEYEHESM